MGLDPLPEDAIKVVRQMRASTPPLVASEMLDQQQNTGAQLIGSAINGASTAAASANKKRSNAVSGAKKQDVS